MLNALIVDDEKSGRNVLEVLIRRYAPDLKLLQSCEDVPAALNAITVHRPDIVFLDIEMPGMNGFEMLEQLPGISFDIVFVTAHGHYAIRAFEYSAFAYLLKPVNKEKFSAVIQKLVQKKSAAAQKEQWEMFLSQIKQPQTRPDKIAIPTNDGLVFLSINSIVRCEAEKNYTHLILDDKRKFMVSKTLKEFENLLDHHGFIRVHRSHLINLKHIDKYFRGDGGYVIMSDQSAIGISPLHKEEFMKRVYKL